MFISDLKAVFLIDEGIEFPLEGVCINFLISPWLMLFTVVWLNNRLGSLLHVVPSVTTSLSTDSLLSTINSFKISCKLALVKGLPAQEGGLTVCDLNH